MDYGDFGKFIELYKWWIFQQAMFDYRRIAQRLGTETVLKDFHYWRSTWGLNDLAEKKEQSWCL